MTQILVLGSNADPHVRRVVDALRVRHGVSCSVLDWKIPSHSVMRMGIDGSHETLVDGVRIEPSTLIWDRVKLVQNMEPFWFRDTDEQSADWQRKEWQGYYRLIANLYPTQVFNSPEAKRCLLKPFQQKIAASVGFKVPATVLTNHKDSAMEFVSRGPSITKTISEMPVLNMDSPRKLATFIVMTMPADYGTLAKAPVEQFDVCPMLLQDRIEKDCELRVVMIGRQIHAFRILSQGLRVSQLDWRHATRHLKFEAVTLAPEQEKKFRLFMEKIGLFTGSLDLIVDKAGDIWFLECNQDGQWGWLDDRVDGAVARGFAEELAFAQRTLDRRTH